MTGLFYPTAAEQLLDSDAGEHWRRIGSDHHHGIALPLFSIHSQTSGGIGEYTDLIKLIDWCREARMDTIQLLPLNDTGNDPSPYSGLSAFALNPIYLNLDSLEGGEVDNHLRAQFRALLQKPRVDYNGVRELKLAFLTRYLEKHRKSLLADPEYQHFVKESPWLTTYALFKALRTKYKRTPWTEWPENAKNHGGELDHAIEFHMLIQFLCDRQMREVRRYAEEHKVLLMGDIPILLGHGSSDVWSHPHHFNCDLSAGAPPDKYSDTGQNWNIPIYEWDSHKQEDYQWWKERLKATCRYFHLYRLDHIIGFFRLWAIPPGKSSLDGHFVPGEFHEWLTQGITHLRMMLENCPLLPVGEDLGLIPNEVKRTLSSMGIPGLKVMPWEHVWDHKNPFGPGSDFHPASLTTVSTHDGPPLRLWWKLYEEEAKHCAAFHGWDYTDTLRPEQLKELLTESHHTASRFHVNPLQEYLGMFSDLASPPEEEQINVPGTVSEKNWTHRFRPSLEHMLDHGSLSATVSAIIPSF